MAQVSGILDTGTLQVGRAPLAYASDADKTLTQAEYENLVLDLGTGTALTATRKLILPVVDGLIFIIRNNTTGGQSVQAIGATGTGVTIAPAKTAIVLCNGTDYVRLTADV